MPMTREELIERIDWILKFQFALNGNVTHPTLGRVDLVHALKECGDYLQSSHESELVDALKDMVSHGSRCTVQHGHCPLASDDSGRCIHQRARDLLNRIKGE